ncbi:non-ribosomal peptide synthase/polyketide synthase [Kitasatospora sp. NBC_01250]|uniref:non-ribosomal peptide synthetase n=1 Tax=Kitasatospora sp. NBC_01250 TaxID=2903571 RepID=UPI002E2F6945|nr:non-ribosomal peptide synthase/polyketide synthase [Kitasatospora sp. NBC_01250]
MIPLSYGQRRLWFLNRLEGGGAHYNMPLALRLTGKLDRSALVAALDDVVERHESLRTVFPERDGEPRQRIVPMARVALSLDEQECTEAELAARLAAEAAYSFDLTSELPLRPVLFSVAADVSVLLLVLHHVAGDGWSLAPLARDVSVAYAARVAGEEPAWEPLPVQYADYTLWQRELLGDEGDPQSLMARQIDFWRGALAGLPEEVSLPGDRLRSAVAGGAGGCVPFVVPAEVHAAVVRLARECGASVFMVVQAALAGLLARLGAGDDIPIGAPLAGRSEEELEDAVGFFVNTVVLRTDVSGDPTFRELVARVRQGDLAAFAHQDVPFERLVEELNPPRSMGRHPLFQVMLAFQNTALPELDLADLRVAVEPVERSAAKFDLSVDVAERFEAGVPAGIEGGIDYAGELYDRETAAAFAGRLAAFLAAVTARPDDRIGHVELVSVDERALVLERWNDTARVVPEGLIHEHFERQVGVAPGAVAVACEGVELSYAELNARANRLARLLIAWGAGPERFVALALPRSELMVVALLAVLKSGAAYLPVDPEYPADRIAYMLEDAAPALVVTVGAVADRLPSGGRTVLVLDEAGVEAELAHWSDSDVVDIERAVPLLPDHPAYLIYTSGSTGRPKGVVIAHRGIPGLAHAKVEWYVTTSESRVLQFSSLSFDSHVSEVWSALLGGGRLVVAPLERMMPGEPLVELVAEQGITHIDLPPAGLAVMPEGSLPLGGTLIVGGEASSPGLVERWFRGRRMINSYGPTEVTVCASMSDPMSGAAVPPIGRPVWNKRVFVLDGGLRLVPPGVVGELYVAGEGLARGYLGRAGLSAERFVACPFGVGERMYRTGDLVRWGGDGQLVFLGRADSQVKVRGFRIELGEVEAAIDGLPGVAQAVVVLHEGVGGERRLVAYVVSGSQTVVGLREGLGRCLPDYMVPSAFVLVEALPLMPNGKVDRRALPEPEFVVVGVGRGPRSPREEILCGLFAEVLGVERVGVDEGFFELGGHSLLATRLASRVRSVLGVEVPLRTLFEAPTVAGLAAVLEGGEVGVRPGLRPVVRPERLPVSFAQRRLWFLNRLEPGSGAYNMPLVLRLTGVLDSAALAAALHDVVGRHESLRTVFPERDGEPEQRIVPMDQVVLSLDERECTEEELAARLAAEAGCAFDLTSELPLRPVLFALAPEVHVLVLVLHHVAGDGWSLAPLARDVSMAYAARVDGTAPGWQPLPVQYADYTLWQRELLGEESDAQSLMARQIDFWRGALAGLPEEVSLPGDRSRPAVAGGAGGSVPFVVPAEVHAAVVRLARECGVSVFMVVQAALAGLLARLGAGEDVPIGAPVAGRTDEALEDAVGFFVNTLVLRTDVSGDPTFRELLGRVRQADLAAFAHQDVPFERLVEELNPPRSMGRHPLFQVMLAFQNTALPELDLADLRVAEEPMARSAAKFDLSVDVAERFEAGRPAGIEGCVEYTDDLYDPRTAAAFAERLAAFLAAVTAEPDHTVGRFDLAGEAERRLVRHAWNDTAHPVPAATLPSVIEAQGDRTPDAPALLFGDTVLSHRELAARANRLARRLVGLGAGPEGVVAVALPRSPELVIALLAVLKSGAAYLPVDPDYPADRIAYMLQDAAPVAVLTCRELAGVLPAGARALVLDDPDEAAASAHHQDHHLGDQERTAPLLPAHPAYLIYTSGSTGRPKGVAVPHAAIVNRLLWMRDQYGIGPADRVLQKTPSSFDVSVWEFFLPLLSGAALVVAPPSAHREPARLAAEIRRHGVTVTHFVPSMLHAFVAEPAAAGCTSLRHVVCSGEALSTDLLARYRQVLAADLHNLYGPTEAAVDVTYHRSADRESGSTVPIGRPVWNTRVFVLDRELRPLPPGVAGELYLAGDQLARGYAGRPALTAERFVACPFTPGTRMYRTGDIVRWNRDGTLVFLGRADHQVKLRGLRIELDEIATVLAGAPGVSWATALVHERAEGDQFLAAYLVSDGSCCEEELRAHLAAALPEYMVPSVLVPIDAVPLSPSGKLDRTALPVPVPVTGTPHRAPTGATEEILCGVFADLLGLDSVGVDDSFFALGGHSLLATRLITRARTLLGAELPLRAVFEAPTVAGLAALVARSATATRPAIEPVTPRPVRVPLSLEQRRLWFLNRLDPDSSAYHMPLALRLTGALDRAALTAALADVVERHESLRTVFPEQDGEPWQQVLPVDGLQGPVAELRECAEASLAGELAAVAGQPFDLTAQLPLRAVLFAIAPEAHVLLLVLHHVAGDGWSMVPLAQDVSRAYAARVAGEAPAWQPLPIQYADYALWQGAVLGDVADPASRLGEQLAYWRKALGDLPEELTLPADRPRPAVATHRGVAVPVVIPAATHQRLVRLTGAHGATLFMGLNAALATLLSRLGAGTDIPIGTPIAGRTDEATNDLVGFFVNTLVTRTDLSGDPTFGDLLQRTRDSLLTAYSHQDLPFDHLVEALNPARSLARHPLFQTLLTLQNTTAPSLELTGLTVRPEAVGTVTAKFDLALDLSEQFDPGTGPAGITGTLTCAGDLFDPETAEAIARRFADLLDTLTSAPGRPVTRADILTEDERRTLLARWNETARELPGATLPELFQAQAARTPDAVAVAFGETELTYHQLNARANRLARVLVHRGVRPESLVAVVLDRSVELVVALLAVLKAGGAYLPIDPGYPAERIAYTLGDAAPALVLTDGRSDLPAGTPALAVDDPQVAAQPEHDLGTALRPTHPAYVIYTSGSTGRPKGVVVPHHALANFLTDMGTRFPLTGQDRWVAVTTIAFDIAALELYLPLISGARVVLADRPTVLDPAALTALLHDCGATIMQATPSLWQALLAHSATGSTSLPALRVLVGGEALPTPLATALRSIGESTNLYGPTETTIWSTAHRLDRPPAAGNPLIGRPIANTRGYVLDGSLNPVPAGVAGDLYLAGDGLARGYLNRPALTAERFTACPFGAPGERMYRTGDLARWRADGTLDYLGRTDHQIKIRGFRVELGDIEAALTSHPSIAQATVVLREDSPGDTRLVGYVTGTAEADAAELRAHVQRMLPDYMVPSAVVALAAFPLTDNGKLDRKALPVPHYAAGGGRAPATAQQEILCGVFAEVLGLDSVGIDDSFFELGGHSLLATRLVSRVRAVFGVELPLRALFEAPTVAALAAALEGEQAGARTALRPAVRPEHLPVSFAQRRLWFLNRLAPESGAYNMPLALRLTGELDRAALVAALADVVERHESLRTVFPEHDGEPEQAVRTAATAIVPLEVRETGAAQLPAALQAAVRQGFDLAAELPLRVHLFDLGADVNVLLLVLHHVAGDGWSLAPLARDVSVAYAARVAGEVPDWEPLPVQYADYALWQRELLGDESDPDSLLSRQTDYWRQALAGLPEEVTLPGDRLRTATAGGGASVPFTLPAPAHANLVRLARECGVSVFMVVQAALAGLLARLGAGEDIPIGSPIAGRTDQALEDAVGFFVNTLVLRTDASGDPTFRELLARVRETDLAAFAHQDVPFERLVEVLNPPRSMGRHPLFQVMLAFQNTALPELGLPGLQVAAEPLGRAAAKFDLSLDVTEGFEGGAPAGLDGVLDYSTDLYDHATVTAFVGRLAAFLTAVGSEPDHRIGHVELVSVDERALVLERWNDTARVVPEGLIHEHFERQVGVAPGAVAVACEGVELSYAELNARANRLARLLIACGAGPEGFVALALPRSELMVVALLAVLKSGAAYLPVDPEYPADRIAYMLGDAAPALVVTVGAVADRLPSGGRTVLVLDRADVVADLAAQNSTDVVDAERNASLLPDHPAYLIYTSGSTGRPKGVVIAHRGIPGLAHAKVEWYVTTSESRVLQFSSLSFDSHVSEVWSALLGGGRLVVAPLERMMPGEPLVELVAEQGITHIDLPPAGLAVMPEGSLPLGGTLIVGGEASSPGLVERWFRGRRMINSYGPTEVTVCASMSDPMSGAAVPPIGRPVWNKRVFVLDGGLRLVPPGVVGELYVAGEGLARGYLGRAGLSAERFVACPFGVGERMYRTGDLVRWGGDGQLVFLGRADSQVKVRGFRIELGEVEAAIDGLPGVAQAVVVLHEGVGGERRLVAYVVSGSQTVVGLRVGLGRCLPDYMVPSAFVLVEALPLMPNGKVDRRALPEPEFVVVGVGRGPRSPREEILCGLFAEVLGVERVGVDEGFFELGGHSLLATRLASRVRSVLGVEVPLRTLFEAPTVAGLAAVLEGGEVGVRPGLRPVVRPERLPVSFAQRRLWFLNRLEPGSGAYNMPLVLRLTGVLDSAALAAALHDVVGRHESLRTVFPERDGEPEQRIVPMDQVVLSLDERECTEEELAARLAAEAGYAFDLTSELPLRATVFRTADDEHVLLLAAHHIVSDGWSTAPLVRDLTTAYTARRAGTAPQWEELPVQYADYTLWQRELLGDESAPGSLLAQQLAYWQQELDGLPDELPLPVDRPRPAYPSGEGGTVPVRIGAELHARVADLARRTHTTVFMVLQAAMAGWLSALGGGEDVPIGTPVAGRTDEAVHDLVGFFVNTLVLRTDVSGDPTFRELLGRVREADLSAFAHQDLPFERLVEELNPPRAMARHPLFQVMLALQNTASARIELDGLTARPVEVTGAAAKFDLSLTLAERFGEEGDLRGLDGELDYAADLFERESVEFLALSFVRFLDSAVAGPDLRVGAVELLSERGRAEVLRQGAGAVLALPVGGSLGSLFAARAAQAPAAVAVVAAGAELSYGELMSLAAELADRLAAMGVRPGALVGLLLPRSVDWVVAQVAVALAGAAWLPLDPGLPAGRIAGVLEEAATAVVLAVRGTAGLVPSGTRCVVLDQEAGARSAEPGPALSLPVPVPGAEAAYVIYTSGSTGRPKGVVVSQRAVVNQLLWMGDRFSVAVGDRVLARTSPGFDAGVWEVWLPLLSGAAVAVVGDEVAKDPGLLIGELAVLGVTVAQFVPTLLAALVAAPGAGAVAGLRQVFVGGEAFGAQLAERVRAVWGVEPVNLYGPTETTIQVTAGTPAGDGAGPLVPIGRPVRNTGLYVLDAGLRLVPPGVVGELYVAGEALARGYLGRPGLTAERFVASPFGKSERMYRTGDLVRWGADGQLVFVGRADQQVKVRGYRIELGEIENVLAGHADVARVAVVVREAAEGDQRLVAYVVPAGESFDPDRLRAHAGALLPGYMLPAAFVRLETLPVTRNGKLDARALPAPGIDRAAPARVPGDPREVVLCALFADVLGLPEVGPDDDFFALGGHSLLAVRLMSAVQETFGARLDLRALFETPTAAGLAARLGEQSDGEQSAGAQSAGDPLDVLLPLRARGSEAPLFCVHPVMGLSWGYAALLRRLDPQRPLYGLQASGIRRPDARPASITAMAREYVARIREVQPAGPYHLLGWSLGGTIAHAMAELLQRDGEQVAFLALLDSYPAAAAQESQPLHPAVLDAEAEQEVLSALLPGAGPAVRELVAQGADRQRILALLREEHAQRLQVDEEVVTALLDTAVHSSRLVLDHVPGTVEGDLVFVTATGGRAADAPTARAAWQPHLTGEVHEYHVDCRHAELLGPEGLAELGRILTERLGHDA